MSSGGPFWRPCESSTATRAVPRARLVSIARPCDAGSGSSASARALGFRRLRNPSARADAELPDPASQGRAIDTKRARGTALVAVELSQGLQNGPPLDIVQSINPTEHS